MLDRLLQALEAGAPRRSLLHTYYEGAQPLAFLAPEAREAMGNRFARVASNIPRLAVTALSERLRVSGFDGVDVWADWLRNDLDQLAPIAHREALAFGESFIIVWADSLGRPLVSVESPTQVAVVRDPATRQVTTALKKWSWRTPREPKRSCTVPTGSPATAPTLWVPRRGSGSSRN